MNWVDGIIITIFIVSTVRGYSEGFVVSLMKAAGLITSVVVARLYFATLANYLRDNTTLYQKIYAAVLKGLGTDIPAFQGPGTEGTKLPGILENLVLYINKGGSDFPVVPNVAEAVSGAILSLLSIIFLFIAVRIIFFAGTALLNSVTALPVLRQFNKLAGLAIGGLKGIIILMVLFAVIVPVITIFPMKLLTTGIQNSSIAVFFYRNNFIMSWMMEIISKMA